MKYIFLSLLILINISWNLTEKDKKVMLLVFAHPDDELAIAPVIAKLSKEYTIFSLYATDGKGGTRVKNIPPDSLGKIRMAEVACSLQQLGAEAPLFLHVERLDSKNSLREFWNQTKWAKDSLKHIIERLSPAVIITIGPDGDTGHPEHRVISGLVTELILREDWYDRFPLYYFMWTKEQVDNYDQAGLDEIMWANKKYANLAVHYSDEDKAKSWEAMKCHDSQYTKEEIEKTIAIDKKDSSNTMYFRKFAVDKTKRNSF